MIDDGEYATIIADNTYWESNQIPINPFVEYWLTFDNLTGEFKGTPEVENIGIFKVIVTASDLNKSVDDIFIMSVTNEGPTLSHNHILKL